MEKTMLTSLRNKNAGRELIDYDLNIFMQEVEDHNGQWYYDPTSWMIHVYAYENGGHQELAEPRKLTVEEIRSLGLNNDSYFEGGDCWYGMAGYLQDYWNVMPDSIKMYLESFPKYKDS
jgi:hypothetical protein